MGSHPEATQSEAEMDDNDSAGICSEAARRLQFFIHEELLQ